MKPAEGERNAVIGFTGQYGLAARLIYPQLSSLEWIKVADPEAGVADDFQFKAGETRHALQVKWSQYPHSFTWGDLLSVPKDDDALLRKLAQAWERIRESWQGPLRIHLCTNNYPSTSNPSATSALGLASVDGPKHFAAFLERSFKNVQEAVRSRLLDMDEIRALPEYENWSGAWKAWEDCSGLTPGRFDCFLRDLDIDLNMPTVEQSTAQSQDRFLVEQRHSDIRALAAELQDLVADRERKSHWDRSDLLARLGWTNRVTYHYRHEFPVPGTYAPSKTAQHAILDALDTFPGGYLALVGPAGMGKSTLLSDLDIVDRVVRYFAFVPNAPDPLSGRGEAESFLGDLSLALNDAGLRRATQPVGLPNLRRTVQDQLALASMHWEAHGTRTVIIIDGLDHVTREQTPSRSMLEELPPTAALGDGVFILLGSQSTQILHQEIQSALSEPGRTIEIPPLTSGEVALLAAQSHLDQWMWGSQIEELFLASEGHPLAVTYILQELTRIPNEIEDASERHTAAAGVLSNASQYGGDVERRYRGYYQAVQDDADIVELLGIVARLRISLNVTWMRTWAAPDAVGRFLELTRTFFLGSQNDWHFVHNSFRRFLVDESSRIGGRIDVDRDRFLHRQLAERCAASGSAWPLYRDEEVAHRYLAHQYERVLEIITIDNLRTKLTDLQPFSTVADHNVIGLKAAADSGDADAFVGLTLFRSELAIREQSFEADKLAEAMVQLLDPSEAVDYVVRGGELRVSAITAAHCAASWARDGHLEVAATVLNAIRGLAGLRSSSYQRHAVSDGLQEWAVATLLVSDLEAVLTQLNRHLPRPAAIEEQDENPESTTANPEDGTTHRRESVNRDSESDEEDIRIDRLAVLVGCFDELLELRDDSQLDFLSAIIDEEGPLSWRARSRLERAIAAADDEDTESALRWIREMLALEAATARDRTAGIEADGDVVQRGTSDATAVVLSDPLTQVAPQSTEPEIFVPEHIHTSLRLRAALTLIELGLYRSPEIDQLIGSDEAAIVKDTPTSESEGDLENALRIRTIFEFYKSTRSVRGTNLSGNDVQSVSTASHNPNDGTKTPDPAPEDPGNARLHSALEALSRFEAELLAHRVGLVKNSPTVVAYAGTMMRAFEVTSEISQQWISWYRIRGMFPTLFKTLIEHAPSGNGSSEIGRLSDLFHSAWTGDRATYWSTSVRHSVLEAFARTSSASHDWVRQWLDRLQEPLTNSVDDPNSRVESWLRQATLRQLVGQLPEAHDAIQSAVGASLGLGAVEDHLQLAHWLEWLDAAHQDGSLSAEAWLAAALNFAARLPGASERDERAASTAGEFLVANLWKQTPMNAVRVGMALCENGVLDENTLMKATVTAALADPEADARILALFVSHLLGPGATSPWTDLRASFEARSDNDALKIFDRAVNVWSLTEETAESVPTYTDGLDFAPSGSNDHDAGPISFVKPRQTPSALLAQLRKLAGNECPPENWWDEAGDGPLAAPMTYAVATALLEQATRFELSIRSIGALCASAAAAGNPAAAAEAVETRLSRLPSGGWFRFYDRGTRQQLFEAALVHHDPTLQRLARKDFVETVSSGIFSWQHIPSDSKRILDLILGPSAVAKAWPIVDAYLDLLAPADPSFAQVSLLPKSTGLPDTASNALVVFAAQWLAHPARVAEEGARRLLIDALNESEQIRAAVFSVLEDAVNAGDWYAESALEVLEVSKVRDLPPSLSSCIANSASCPDAVLRDLAGSICDRVGLQRQDPQYRELSPMYQMIFPPLGEHTFPEVDKEGIPYVNRKDPRQVIAPFDFFVGALAQDLGVPPEAAIRRAANFALAQNGNRWTDGGNRSMTEQLKRRGQLNTFRPWAYLVGRRAASRVLGEMVDAFPTRIPDMASIYFGLASPELLKIQPDPLAEGTPVPWRAEDERSYDTSQWCPHVNAAATSYKSSIESEQLFVLAESSEWKRLGWGNPRETRLVLTTNIPGAEPLKILQQDTVEYVAGARDYPHNTVMWENAELVVRGSEDFTNAPFLNWWALHPAVAHRLGWSKDPDSLFGWIGSDGAWRSRTEYLARGLLSDRSPRNTSVGEVWRVVLSPSGYKEFVTHFSTLSRSLTVNRTLPPNARENRSKQNTEAVVLLSTDLPTISSP